MLGTLAGLMPVVALTQPLNALAFVMDGCLYGVQGFALAARAMLAACVPAGALMLAGASAAASSHSADLQLSGVWAGLATLMVMRFATLYVPLRAGAPPFDKLRED